ncbi:MAG TPA: LytR C-terminal domain-containing protein [Kineosporiaceae bacterium]|nr:LytR C-terminal domain-containing protein [Kineosporiaceae bacterium]
MSATKPPPGYDDRFVVPLEPSRRGAHRARVSPLIGALPVVAVVAVVTVVIVLAWTLFGHQTSGSGAAAGGGVTSAAGPGGSTPAATGGGSAATTPNPQATTTPTESAGGGTKSALNQAISVTVLNTTGRNGLAAKVATLLVGKGWTAAKSAKTVVTARPTTVFYATNEQKAEADAIVTDLGVGAAKKSTTMGPGITVVLGSDYPTTG